MPFSLARKTIVKAASSQYIVVSGSTIKIQKIALAVDFYHSFYHKALAGKLKSNHFLNKIAKSPERILEIEGSKKVNLILYLAFIKQADATKLQLGHIDCSRRQRKLYGLLSCKRKAWNKLFRKYPGSFMKLREYLQIESIAPGKNDLDRAAAGNGIEKVSRNEKLLKCLLRHSQSRDDSLENPPKIVKLHKDFCEAQKCNYISSFGQDYTKMIENVLDDSGSEKMVPNSYFFPEVCLYNDYLLTKDDPDFLDQSLFKQKFTTLHERGVRDYVKRKLEEKHMSRRCL